MNESNVKLTLTMAKVLSNLIEDYASNKGLHVVIAIDNDGANPIYVSCMDDSYIASYDIALNKAFTCASLKMSTSKLKSLAQPGGSLYGIQFTNQGKIVVFGGGVVLKYKGKILGALGVSGGSEEQDTDIAEYGERIFAKVVESILA